MRGVVATALIASWVGLIGGAATTNAGLLVVGTVGLAVTAIVAIFFTP